MALDTTYNYDLRTFQKRSVVLLETIHNVCRKHGIRYFLIDGTLLGAVRHQGFIPWDDDMDIALMRNDYDELIKHADEWIPEPFRIVCHENTPKYPKYFAKLEDTSTTIVENIYLGYAGGIYIDIFPLDEVPSGLVRRAVHYYRFDRYRSLLYFLYRDPYKHGKGFSSFYTRLIQKLFDKERIHRKADALLREYAGRGMDCVMTHDNKLTAYRKSCFNDSVTLTFEGVEADAPVLYKEVLADTYGDDFMEMPPDEKRRAHYHDYCDLNSPYRDFDIRKFIEERKKSGK